jgi:HEAT repeat protein/cyclophilin family peptidyl-prolyl cis-trans isomerase
MIALALAAAVSACASAPPAPVIAPARGPSFEQKLAWILRLEDSRTLRDPAPPPQVPPPLVSQGRRSPPVAATPAPPPPPDLIRLLGDEEARVRRRAALAVGRVGLAEGVVPLVTLLRDSDPEVRQMAAFALGLIGDKSARDPLVAALADESLLVAGSAAEALGLVGDVSAASSIAQMAKRVVDGGALTSPPGDAADAERDSPAGALRLALGALGRLRAYDPIASVVLDASGQPRIRWWPAAYALQRLEDRRAAPALLTLVGDPHAYTRAFAAKGLGALKHRPAVPALIALLNGPDRGVAVEAARALGAIGDATAARPLLALMRSPRTESVLRLEAVSALGGVRGDGVYEALLDSLGDPSPPFRAAAMRSLSRFDPEGFVTALAGLEPDKQWTVRAALAETLSTLAPEAGLPRLHAMLRDADPRVLPSVLTSLTTLQAPDAGSILLDRLKADDYAVRAAAAAGLGRLKLGGTAEALVEAYRFGLRDESYAARVAALTSLTAFGASVATPVLTEALADKDWAVRRRAAQLLNQLSPSADAASRIRPAPIARAVAAYSQPDLANPKVSIQVFLDTDRGSIQLELAMLDAPLSIDSFLALAGKRFFDGLTFHRVVPGFVIQGGDPRGDSEGGPGYSMRDEINQQAFARGTVGFALDGADTAGSQFFIVLSPQPQLDARYTAFGRVTAGMDVVDRIEPGDQIRRVRVWDGQTMK